MWRLFNKTEEVDEHLKKYYETQKERQDTQLGIDYRIKKLDYEIRIAHDMKVYEHDYHKGMEDRRVQLAKLDAEIEYKKSLLDDVLEEKKSHN